ncbi:MAG: hypothetical protein ABI653_06275 [Bacteroidota bacterium]
MDYFFSNGFGSDSDVLYDGEIVNTFLIYMRTFLKYLIPISFSVLLFSCSTNVKLIEKTHTNFGIIKFFAEQNSKPDSSIKRIYAEVKTSGNKSYYSFYRSDIVKTTDSAKALMFTVVNEKIPVDYDVNIYQKFSYIDSFVLNRGEKLLEALGLNPFKRLNGAGFFAITVYYLHGYPKYQKFKP